MKIKNKGKFIERAEGHKALDRIISDHYVTEDGPEKGFEGCLIGCMAVPYGTPQAKRRVAKLRGEPKFRGSWHVSEEALIDQIVKEFGICAGLQRVGEYFLMSLEGGSPQRLGGFVLEFAKAVPEGVDVTDEAVEEWLKSRPVEYKTRTTNIWGEEVDEPLDFRGNMVDARGGGLSYEDRRSYDDSERKAFLRWLRGGCRAPKAKAKKKVAVTV